MKMSMNTDADRIALRRETRAKVSDVTADDWQRIFAMKLTDADREKLAAVRSAIDSGKLSRHAEDRYTKTGRSKRISKAECLRLYAELAELEREDKLHEMVANTPNNYELITTYERFETLIDSLASEPIIAIDTETTGLDVYADHIVGISLTSPNANWNVYIPVGHIDAKQQLPRSYVLYRLTPMLTDVNVKKVLHNANYDIQMFMRYGIEVVGVAWDTQIAMHLLNENEPSYQLKKLATRYLHEPSDTFEQLFGKNAQFATVPLDIALVYAAKDTAITWKLYEFQRKYLEKMPTILSYYRDVEVPLIQAIVAMERTGFVIDTEYAQTYGVQMQHDIERLENELHTEIGDINLNSPMQLKEALERITRKQLESTDAKKVLKPLASKFPVIAKFLEYKSLVKLYSTYISVLPTKINPVTGRLHARFNPMGTVTGRFSSGGNHVNLQNQSHESRKLFVAPKGYVIIGADFSQQEYRCLAYFTQEPLLVEAYKSGKDLYSTMAARIFHVPYEECGDGTVYRKKAKVGLLATVYGTSKYTLATQLGISVDEADKFLNDLFASMPKVAEWIEENKKFVRHHGYVWADKQYRKRRLPDATLREKAWRVDRGESKRTINRALRQATNARVQGSASVQTKVTINAMYHWCLAKQAAGRDFRLWCTVHDENLTLAPIDVTRNEIEEIRGLMLHSYPFGDIPLKTDIELMVRWGDGMTVDEWFEKYPQ
jgi:DNA polymerase-1